MSISQDEYAEQFTSPLSDLAHKVLNHTLDHHPQSHMVSGWVQGQFLRLFSMALQPQRILEIGTFTGFSALCLAEGLAIDGILHTIENREEEAVSAQAHFDNSPFKHHIKLHTGEAKEIIPTLQETWDLVFIDADKTGYETYLDLVMPSLRPGGIILADNVLFHGEVLQDEIKGKNAKAIHAFNEKVRNTPGIEQVLLTIRDGLLMIRKCA